MVLKLGVGLSFSLRQKSELPQGWGVEGGGKERRVSQAGH